MLMVQPLVRVVAVGTGRVTLQRRESMACSSKLYSRTAASNSYRAEEQIVLVKARNDQQLKTRVRLGSSRHIAAAHSTT